MSRFFFPGSILLALAFLSCGSASLPLGIQWQEHYDGVHTFYSFSLKAEDEAPLPEDLEVLWRIGDQSFYSGEEIYYAFSYGGTQSIQADFVHGAYKASPLLLEAKNFSLPKIKKYLTLEDPQSPFLIPGKIQRILGPLEDGLNDLKVLGSSEGWQIYQAPNPGFYNLWAKTSGRELEYNLFVSPLPSFHLERNDRNWYYTQFRTTTSSNCGPSVVSIALAWARGKDLPVAEVRRMMGWSGAGAVTLEEMREILLDHEVKAEVRSVESTEDIFEILERGHLVGLVYDMAGLEEVDDPANNLLGQYYTDYGGHYLAIKGFSLDKQYFITHDPIPSDWYSNEARYHDGESMWGRNRYYPAQELFDSLRRQTILAVEPVL